MTEIFGNNSKPNAIEIIEHGPNNFESILHNRLYWYILWLILYLIVTLVIYAIFRIKKHEHPFISTLKISRIRWILIAIALYILYILNYKFVWSCTNCAFPVDF